jgi:hypothetical protein
MIVLVHPCLFLSRIPPKQLARQSEKLQRCQPSQPLSVNSLLVSFLIISFRMHILPNVSTKITILYSIYCSSEQNNAETKTTIKFFGLTMSVMPNLT